MDAPSPCCARERRPDRRRRDHWEGRRALARTVVLGLGNLLLGDEGVGVHAAHALAHGCPSDTDVLDVGTALLDALPALETAERVIVIDAVQAGGPPGSVYRLRSDEVAHKRVLGGLHGFDLARVVALTGRPDLPEEVIVFGVEPASMGWSLELSPAVAAALPFLLEAVRQEITPAPCACAPPRPRSSRGAASLRARR